MASRRPRLYVGTSGYQYRHWRTRFYPHGLPQKEWFNFYARHFDCVEINATYYRLPSEETFAQWHETAPRGFRYVLKYSRFGSHLKHLKDPSEHVDLFLARAAPLKGLLAGILVQLPPQWKPDLDRLDEFLSYCPRRYRWTIEFRNQEWLMEKTFDLLRRHGAGLCIHDLLPDHPREVTSGWVYQRFHGRDYGGNYSDAYLAQEAQAVRGWLTQGLDVYAFFNNDRDGHALGNAMTLRYEAGA